MTAVRKGTTVDGLDGLMMRPIRIYSDVKKSFIISWLVMSVVIFMVIASPFVFSEKFIYNIAPQCEWKAIAGIFLCAVAMIFGGIRLILGFGVL